MEVRFKRLLPFVVFAVQFCFLSELKGGWYQRIAAERYQWYILNEFNCKRMIRHFDNALRAYCCRASKRWKFDKKNKKWELSVPVPNQFSYLSFSLTLPLSADRGVGEQIEHVLDERIEAEEPLHRSLTRSHMRRVRGWLEFLTDPLFARVFFPRNFQEIFRRDISAIKISWHLRNGQEDGKEDDKEIFFGQRTGRLKCCVDLYKYTFFRSAFWVSTNAICPYAFRITYTEEFSGCSCAVVFGFDNNGCLSGWFMEHTYERFPSENTGVFYYPTSDGITHLRRCIYVDVIRNLRETFDTKNGKFLPYPFNPDKRR